MSCNQIISVLVLTGLMACKPKAKETSDAIAVSLGILETISEQSQYARIGSTRLSDYNFFKGPLKNLEPTENVEPYELNTPLFTDYAKKKRFIYLPEGTTINYHETEVLQFPVGTVLIKNFYYDSEQLVGDSTLILETRLLLHKPDGWKALPYIWNKEQTEAYLEITGGSTEVELNNQSVNYQIPDMTQCKSCHDINGNLSPIGPSARQLNKVVDGQNQLERLVASHWIQIPQGVRPKLAIWDDPGSGSLDERARAYLDINCAHCHRPEGPAKNSGLSLDISISDAYQLGINKKPVAAGRGSADLEFNIVPGNPDASILVHRMSINEPGTMMPELGRTIVHEEGVELIREWIEKM